MKFQLPQKYIDENLVRVVRHPSLPLRIFNYTEVCQYSRSWDDVTKTCRGLVVDADDNVIARPFKKFFNWEELVASGETPQWPPEVITSKLDGSLGILYWYEGEWRMNTRGSFQSEQAVKGLEIFQKFMRDQDLAESIRKDCTHLFEIIYPENRIVLDYGPLETLVYLGSIITETGEEKWLDEMEDFHLPLWKTAGSIEELYAGDQSGQEGYVLKWPDGTRAKIKFDEYKRLHHLLTGVTERNIWEILRTGGSMEDIVKQVPDEFYKWVSDVERRLRSEWTCIHMDARSLLNQISIEGEPQSRKEWAERIVGHAKNPGVCFAILDKKDPSEQIWRLIKPPATKPFKLEI